MRSLGTVRRIDSVGRISIPAQLRCMHNINTDDFMELYQEGTYIILKKYVPKCVFCGGAEKVETFKTKFICQNCMNNIIISSSQ